jgi:hypothetical protein
MSTISPTSEQHSDTDRRDSFESMTPREQLLGMLVVIVVLLLAIVMKSL